MRPSLERETVHMLHFNLIIGGNQEFVERLQYSAPQRDFGHLRDWTKQIDTSIKIVRTQARRQPRSEEHTSELQSLMRISYAVFCLKKKKTKNEYKTIQPQTH